MVSMTYKNFAYILISMTIVLVKENRPLICGDYTGLTVQLKQIPSYREPLGSRA